MSIENHSAQCTVTFWWYVWKFHKLMGSRQQGWRRRPGRQRHTWLRTPNADLHPLNHGFNSAWRLDQDRERWRQLAETATLHPGARSWWWWWWWWWDNKGFGTLQPQFWGLKQSLNENVEIGLQQSAPQQVRPYVRRAHRVWWVVRPDTSQRSCTRSRRTATVAWTPSTRTWTAETWRVGIPPASPRHRDRSDTWRTFLCPFRNPVSVNQPTNQQFIFRNITQIAMKTLQTAA